MQKDNIREVLTKHVAKLMDIPGVTGLAEGKLQDEPCITIFVTDDTPEILSRIPSNIEGYPVQVVGGGEFRALASRD